jgi:hypothetical protein
MKFRRYILKNYPYVLPAIQNEYKTMFVWSGLKRLDTRARKCHIFSYEDNLVCRDKVKYPDHLSRVDYIEDVNVKIYSDGLFSENDELFVCENP